MNLYFRNCSHFFLIENIECWIQNQCRCTRTCVDSWGLIRARLCRYIQWLLTTNLKLVSEFKSLYCIPVLPESRAGPLSKSLSPQSLNCVLHYKHKKIKIKQLFRSPRSLKSEDGLLENWTRRHRLQSYTRSLESLVLLMNVTKTQRLFTEMSKRREGPDPCSVHCAFFLIGLFPPEHEH